MRPASLPASAFARYPPLARRLAETHLELLRQLPLSFLGPLLGQVIDYDWRFPAERVELDQQIAMLAELSAADLSALMEGFRALPISEELYAYPWAVQPAAFVEKLTAHLWTQHAIDQYREAALAYGKVVGNRRPREQAPVRWCFVVIGSGSSGTYPHLFRKLRTHGTLFQRVDASSGLRSLQRAIRERAQHDETPYAHWYVEGGRAESGLVGTQASVVSYEALSAVRGSLLRRMHNLSSTGTVGPESLRSLLAQLKPSDLEWNDPAQDEVLKRFQLSLLTEGSGTQIFSTTFVQWSGREILRRAKPHTLLLRYAPRQVDRPMDDLLLARASAPELDPEGSLEDADMGAYYTWLNLMRLPGADTSRFVAWRENGTMAMVIAPGMARGTVSNQPCTVQQILEWIA